MARRAKNSDELSELSFEQAIDQLEALIERIEAGEIGLEEALKQYEAGMALIRRCRTVLSTAERKIAEITVEPDGELAVSGEAEADAADEDEGDVPI